MTDVRDGPPGWTFETNGTDSLGAERQDCWEGILKQMVLHSVSKIGNKWSPDLKIDS